jgi:signal transduction histidine kinase
MERKQAEENSRNLITAIDAMNECVTYYDADDKLIFSNKRHQVFNSAVPETLAPGSTFESHMKGLLARGLVPNAQGREDEWLRERLDSHRDPKGPFELLRQDGIWMLIHEQRLPEGGIITLATDITERKAIDEQLRQAQKMEAVGQLTAGVAHDFNNMLAVISGNAELLEEELGKDNPRLATVYRATERAAELIQRLLAFSRRQVLKPEIINANSLIAEITGLLRHTLEEDIDIESVSTTGLWNCEVDPAQLENALVNLALNARDAMPDGGKLTIETANARLDDDYAAAQAEVTPGQYVMLAVTDTGTGMSPKVREHVFEPFFTTKAVGDGSGLGLSMVYGFVKQSGGHVTVYSEEGEGTTIKLYLPRSTETAAEKKEPVMDEVPVAQGETVLVVEDDPDLRTLAVALLSSLGYRIIEAATGVAALEELESMSGVNLLLTDVVLPGGMNGRELATEAERRAPGIQVLYMSGYTEDAIMHHGRLDADAELLQKPFRRSDLARAVRRALDDALT